MATRGHQLLQAVNEARLAVLARPCPELQMTLDRAETALDEYDRAHGYRRRQAPSRVYQHGEKAGGRGTWRPKARPSVDDEIECNLRNFVELVEEVDGWMVGEDPEPFEWSRDGTLSIARLGVERGLLYVIQDTADIYATTPKGQAWLKTGGTP